MPTVRVTRKASDIYVESPYNTLFVAEARRLYGRWREGAWWFDLYLQDRVREALREIYGTDGDSPADTVTVRVRWDRGAEVFRDGIVVAGRHVATAHPNGEGVTLGAGVELEEGLFYGGANGRHWSTRIRFGTTILMRDFPRALVDRPRCNAGSPDVTIVEIAIASAAAAPAEEPAPLRMHRTDEWILGEGCDSTSRYLVHTAAPRFACRVSLSDDVAETYLTGMMAVLADGSVLHSFVWFDVPSAELELRDLVAAAELALIRKSLD